MNGDFMDALRQLEREKEIPLESLVETVEKALASAYKKHTKAGGNIRVQIEPVKGVAFKVFRDRHVVESEVTDQGDILLADALLEYPDAKVGDLLTEEVNAADFGRIAAQTAKQVVMQGIRDVERQRTFEEFLGRVGEVVSGVIQRRDQRSIIMNIGKIEAVLPPSEQVPGEPYHFNDRVKVIILDVRHETKGPQVIVSRSSPQLILRLFELEVPEIEDGAVTIRSIAREPGKRTKIAVASEDDKVDPIGACVGQRGSRVLAVVNELHEEKIDIVRWDNKLEKFVEAALSPAKVSHITLSEDHNTAMVVVPDNQSSLAIGIKGQNVRLAARLCGLKIEIRNETQIAELEAAQDDTEEAAAEEPATMEAPFPAEPMGEEAQPSITQDAEMNPASENPASENPASENVADTPGAEVPSAPSDGAASPNDSADTRAEPAPSDTDNAAASEAETPTHAAA